MRKILLIISTLATVLFIVLFTSSGNKEISMYSKSAFVPPISSYSTSDIKQEFLEIEIRRDGNKLELVHSLDYQIVKANIEYSYMDNNTLFSRLGRFDVLDNKISVESSYISFKLHQVKIFKNQTYYTYSVKDNELNQIGSLDNARRVEIAEIETVQIEEVCLVFNIPPLPSVMAKEFYFNFNKENDYVEFVDVEYVLERYNDAWLFGDTNFISVEERIVHTSTLKTWTGDILPALGVNTKNTIPATHVVRITPKYNNKSGGVMRSFAIVRIGYYIDGEFQLDEVLNEPVVPPIPENNDDWLNALINFLNSTFDLNLNKASLIGIVSTVIAVIFGIICFPAVVSFIPLILNIIIGTFKTLIRALASLFKLAGLIIKGSMAIIKFIIVPSKKAKT